MDVIFNLAALAFGLFWLLCPIIVLVMTLNARNRITVLERTTGELHEKISRLTGELASQRAGSKPTSDVLQSESTVASSPGSTVTDISLAVTKPSNSETSVVSSSPMTANKPWDIQQKSAAQATQTRLPDVPVQTPTGDEAASALPTSQKPSQSPWLEDANYSKNVATGEFRLPDWAAPLKTWLMGGNLVAKAGLLILFLGVSFLLKYAAARITVPIEYRLIGIVLADFVLLHWSWRIREQRPAISLPVQGAAIAILMLVTFGAYKIYGLIPGIIAFALLFLLTAFTCLLAILQDALWLAVFGIAGGFAAPILTTTDGGSHIGLFSYYAILNGGILAIALYRSWRLLNLIGFAFTFVIGSVWGVLRYTPEHYLSVQLFLILYFVFYVAISLLYSYRQAPNLKHYMDGTLVFGVPLLAFGLQYGLVKHMEFGLAYSSLALGLFYIATALILWKQRGTSLSLLTESFLALGIVFGTLAIPFALDGRWTSAAWALEGAGMVWVGLKQRQTLAWFFGLLVQFGAWLSFIGSVTGLDAISAMQSNLWLGFLLLAATAFLMAVNFRSHSDGKQSVDFAPLATAFLAFAAIWLLAGAWTEVALRTEGPLQANLLVVSGLTVTIILSVIASQMHWQMARRFALFTQILAGLVFLVLATFRPEVSSNSYTSLFAGPFLGALLIGSAALFSSWFFHRQVEWELSKVSTQLLWWSGFWWFGFVLYYWSEWVQGQYRFLLNIEAYREDGLFWCAYGLSLAIVAPGFAWLASRIVWPALRWSGVAVWIGLSVSTLATLGILYIDDLMPYRETWWAYLALWGVGEWLLAGWPKRGWKIDDFWLRSVHSLRTVGPWLMIWPVGRRLISNWLDSGTAEQQALLAEAGWFTAGSWGLYLPAWAMMLVIFWVIRQSRNGAWPVQPIPDWYQRVLIPLGVCWSVFLVAVWNLTQNGLMEPLPYLPLLNPLDLTTGFSVLLGLEAYRLLRSEEANWEMLAWLGKIPWFAALLGYVWFNLMLLRSVAVFLGIPYQFEPLFGSQFIQTMLSLVWSGTALVLMRVSAQRVSRKAWMMGAFLLGIVVAKLFLIDLSNIDGLERVVSFVGVGLLMLAIGYLAPFPTESGSPSDSDGANQPNT